MAKLLNTCVNFFSTLGFDEHARDMFCEIPTSVKALNNVVNEVVDVLKVTFNSE